MCQPVVGQNATWEIEQFSVSIFLLISGRLSSRWRNVHLMASPWYTTRLTPDSCVSLISSMTRITRSSTSRCDSPPGGLKFQTSLPISSSLSLV